MTPLSIAVLTVSDTRTEETDKSGAVLIECLQAALSTKTRFRDDDVQIHLTWLHRQCIRVASNVAWMDQVQYQHGGKD